MENKSSLLRKYLKPQRGKVLLLSLFLFGSIALDLLAPQQLQRFIDSAQAGRGHRVLVDIAIVFVVMTIGRQLVVSVAGYLSEDIGWRATNLLRLELVDHCLALDPEFHKEHTAGELMERVDGDSAVLSDFLSFFVFSVIGRAFLAVGILALVFATDYRIGLLLLVFSMFVVLVLRRLQKVAIPYFTELRKTKADLSGFLDETLVAAEDIRANGTRPHVMHQLGEQVMVLVRRTRDSMVSARIFSSVLEISLAVATGGVLATSAYLLPGRSITLGGVFVIYYYTQLLSLSLMVITRHLDSLQKASGAMQRIAELLSIRPTITDGSGAPLPEGPLSIRFEDVSFAYSEGNPVLEEVSFEVAAGESVGLLGRTGSGKSTITRLLCRAFDTDSGRVRIGGVDVRDLEVSALRSRIGVVTQEVQLFHATVRDNVTLFDPTISDEAIERAITELGLEAWYTSLSEGLDTIVAGGGNTLSAGEGQLLALTRILLRNPDIVVLDEASSRLDPGTERLIEQATDRLLQGRTGVVVAHRLATVQNADHIVVLADGRVRESGRREDLSADSSSQFATMLAGGVK